LNNDLEIYVPTKSESEYIGKNLLEYNLSVIPLEQQEPFIEINRCIKNSDGDVIGGILATSALWHILHIETLWVNQAFRGNKIASKLIQDVEEYAKRLGCHLFISKPTIFKRKSFILIMVIKYLGPWKIFPKGMNVISYLKDYEHNTI